MFFTSNQKEKNTLKNCTCPIYPSIAKIIAGLFWKVERKHSQNRLGTVINNVDKKIRCLK